MIVRPLTGWRIDWQGDAVPVRSAVCLTVAGLGAAGVVSLMLLMSGADPVEAFMALLEGAMGSRRAVAETMVKATPLILTGLAATVAFRARLWNIGAEGQAYAGAMMAYWAQSNLTALPAIGQVAAVLIGAIAGGAVFAGLAGVLKTAFRVDEVIATVLLNYIVIFALSLLLLGVWSEAGSFYEQSPKVDQASWLPMMLDGTRLHLGFPLALGAAFLVHILIKSTPIGFEIRAAGSNLRALEVQGTSTVRIIMTVMLISGGLAGLAGATEVYGVDHRLAAGALVGLGYTGIVVAILGQLHPLGVVLAAILFGALLTGATTMQIEAGVPTALIFAIQAIILLFYLVGRAAAALRLRRVVDAS